MVDKEEAFGYDLRIPESLREFFMWLCQDVAALQSKWDFYLELFGNEDNDSLLSELASWSFNIIEETLRNDMTMAICRLSDPSVSYGKENLSLATLVSQCPDVPELKEKLNQFQLACEPISKWRNKQVGHNDLGTKIHPRKNPLPGITKVQIDKIIDLASDILKCIALYYGLGDLNFHTISRGGAKDLIFWLQAGKEYHSR